LIFALVILLLLAAVVVVPWLFLFLVNDPGKAIRDMPYREFLGPGGPDDPFTVRIPREAHEELLARQPAQTGKPRVLRAADEQHPRPAERTGLPPAA
jgi:hypothetical protein